MSYRESLRDVENDLMLASMALKKLLVQYEPGPTEERLLDALHVKLRATAEAAGAAKYKLRQAMVPKVRRQI